MSAPASLGDLFKKKKKVKTINLNLNNDLSKKKETAEDAKKEQVEPEKQEDEWQEETIEVKTLKINDVGAIKQVAEEEVVEDKSFKWGKAAKGKDEKKDDRYFPTLAKAATSNAVAIRNEVKKTTSVIVSRNQYATLLEEEEEEEIAASKEPSVVAAKKQGEMVQKKELTEDEQLLAKKAKAKDMTIWEIEELKVKEAEKDVKRLEARERLDKPEEEKEAAPQMEKQIVADEEAIRAKYLKRRKLPTVSLPASEMIRAC